MSPDHGPHTTMRRRRPPAAYATSPAWSGRPTDDESWRDISSCATADPELFHPELEEGHGTSVMKAVTSAKKVCVSCPVRIPCLVYALERKERFGVWGGEGRTSRKKIISAFPADPATELEAA